MHIQSCKDPLLLIFCVIKLLVSLSKYSGTCLIRHTKGPEKCVGLYWISEYSGFILVKRNTLGP